MITMVLGGLWHGAAWTFVLWGVYQGLGLVVEHALGGRLRLPGWLRWLMTFHLIVFGWILFRAQSLATFWTFLSRLTVPGPADAVDGPDPGGDRPRRSACSCCPPHPLERLQVRIEELRPAILATGLAIVVVFAGATVTSQGVPPFIYFRF